jgi:hypothetical protein
MNENKFTPATVREELDQILATRLAADGGDITVEEARLLRADLRHYTEALLAAGRAGLIEIGVTCRQLQAAGAADLGCSSDPEAQGAARSRAF